MAIANKNFHWLVGLLEGEGSFGLLKSVKLHKGKTYVYKYPQISLVMCDQDVVVRAADLMGATAIHKKKNPKHNPTYQFTLGCRRAAEWMKKLQPYLGDRRRQQIDYALSHSSKEYI